MIVINPDKRINIDNILEHPYLINEKEFINASLPI